MNSLSPNLIAKLNAGETRSFPDLNAWNAHLAALGITGRTSCLIATEGVIYGALIESGAMNPETVIRSDGAGQFDFGILHALCWIHQDRLIKSLPVFDDTVRQIIITVRGEIRDIYRDFKACQRNPDPEKRAKIEQAFDAVFGQTTGIRMIDDALHRIARQREDRLRGLDCTAVPLNTNDRENDVRCPVTRRKVSSETRSEKGRNARDAFMSLLKTGRKHGISAFDYFCNRLGITGAPRRSVAARPGPSALTARSSPLNRPD